MLRCSVAALALLTACAGSPASDTAMKSLDGTAWNLRSFGDEPALPSSTVTLSFEADQLAGSGGVNRYFGGWSIEDGRLQLEGVGTTRMAGPADVMEQEQRYFTTLGTVDDYELDADLLRLRADGRTVLVFERAP